ncbi:HNH endonuclease [Corynebacterium doosanense]|uniref:HNH endonuclease n=1 Tax=Corynebacterium doosanense TaxID=1121358 RepID=UPI001FE2343D|nr:HNH endonuclease signature motif containing protein [Corynebacterium doosanense]
MNRLTDGELVHELTTAHGGMTVNQAAFVLHLAEFDRRELYREQGASSTVAWLGRRLNIGRSAAYGYVQTSKSVVGFPSVAAAFLAGELTYSQVQLLCRYLTESNELELLALATSMSVRELEMALAGHPPGGEGEGGERPRTDHFDVWIDDHGRYRFSGELSPALGAQFLAAIKIGELANVRDLAEIEEERLDDDNELDHLLAEADAPEKERSVTRFGPAMKADLLPGFIGMVNLARSSKTSAARAPGAQVHVVVTEDGHAFMPLNPAAPSESLLGLVNDGELRGYLLDSKGVALKMGRKRRLASRSQESALLVTWQFRCATPGCCHTRFLEFHHIKPWQEGGLTDMENLIPLCSSCHALVTDGQIQIIEHPTDAHRLVFLFTDGTRFVSLNRGMPVRDDSDKDVITAKPAVVAVGDWDENPDLGFADDDGDDSEKSSRRLDDFSSPVEQMLEELLAGVGA